jgi:hypothetical protein
VIPYADYRNRLQNEEVTIADGLTITLAGGILAALVTAGAALRRWLGAVIAAALLIVPFTMKGLAPASYQVTLTLAFVIALRTMDLRGEQPSRRAGLRILHAFMPFDTRLATWRRSPRAIRLFFDTVLWAAVSYVAFRIAANSPAAPLAAHYVVRWLFGMVWVLALFETVAHVIHLILAMAGVRIPALHSAPYMARSLREFWGVRWNKLIGRWLREHCYAPFAQRGQETIGMIVSFAVSAGMHLYITAVLLNVRWGLIMSALFFLQVPLLWAEDALHIRRRPTWVGRVWTLGVLLLLSPLFTEPVLRIFGA